MPLFPRAPTPPAVQARIDAWLEHRAAIRDNRARLGLVGYAHLAAMLVHEPSTVAGLMRRAGMGHVSAYRFIGTLRALRYAHVAGWEMEPLATTKPVWAFGPGPDTPEPTVRPNGRPIEALRLPGRHVQAGVLHFVALLRAIEVPMSMPEIMEATGLHRDPLTDCLRALVQLELAHEPLWAERLSGGAPLRHYQVGRGPNAASPLGVLRRQNRRLENARQRGRRQSEVVHQALHAIAGRPAVAAGGPA